jgi:hypothetical protein
MGVEEETVLIGKGVAVGRAQPTTKISRKAKRIFL